MSARMLTISIFFFFFFFSRPARRRGEGGASVHGKRLLVALLLMVDFFPGAGSEGAEGHIRNLIDELERLGHATRPGFCWRIHDIKNDGLPATRGVGAQSRVAVAAGLHPSRSSIGRPYAPVGGYQTGTTVASSLLTRTTQRADRQRFGCKARPQMWDPGRKKRKKGKQRERKRKRGPLKKPDQGLG